MISLQPHRLPPNHGFAAAAIDRAQPITFQLNGQAVHGYAGDTILSAALASGITEAGLRGGEPLGLDEFFAPNVVPLGAPAGAMALPMGRTPAADGLDLVTVGPRVRHYFTSVPAARVRHFLAGPRRTMGHNFDWPAHLADIPAPPVSEQLGADLVVVGGGIAGLSAALAAGRNGDRVILVERRPYVGGDAPFFPVGEGELAADDALEAITAELSSLQNVEVLTRAEATSLEGNAVTVEQVVADGGPARLRFVRISADRIVLATGSNERLPVFPGNRSPRVTGTLTAYHRAQRYGVWLGRKAIFSTIANAAYRLPIRATEAGVKVQRVVDVRGQVVSRFIDFAKASGIQLTLGSIPYAAEPPGQGLAGLYAHFAVTFDGRPTGAPVWTEQLIVSGSWQPAIDLWIGAGGDCRWSRERGRLEAAGELDHVALAGGAAGIAGTMACARSGEAAVARLFGRQAVEVCDPDLDPRYETPASMFPPIRPGAGVRARAAYLDGGVGLASIKPAPRMQRLPAAPARPLGDHPSTISLRELAAAVELGEIAPADAGEVARERCIPPLLLMPGTPCAVAAPARPAVPAYLEGRFGDAPALWTVEPTESRVLDVGALIYLHPESTDPGDAVGVIVSRSVPGTGGVALIGKIQVGTGDRLILREQTAAYPIRVAERVERALS